MSVVILYTTFEHLTTI